MMRSSILGASTMLNVLIQHLPLQSLFWTKIWRALRASDPSNSMVWTLPSEVSKSLPGLVKGFTHALGELADSFSDGGGFPYGIIFSQKFFLHLGSTCEFFP